MILIASTFLIYSCHGMGSSTVEIATIDSIRVAPPPLMKALEPQQQNLT